MGGEMKSGEMEGGQTCEETGHGIAWVGVIEVDELEFFEQLWVDDGEE